MESGCKISYFSHKFPTPATRTLSVRISYAAFYWVIVDNIHIIILPKIKNFDNDNDNDNENILFNIYIIQYSDVIQITMVSHVIHMCMLGDFK